MFDKFQDALVVLVFFYMVYRVGWGSGMTGINTFMLLCAVVALISIALKRTGYLDRMKEKKLEEERRKRNRSFLAHASLQARFCD